MFYYITSICYNKRMNFFRADKKFERFEDVTPEILQQHHVELLLCDLDNTLRLHSEKEPTDELIAWIKACKKAGIKLTVISNNGRKKMMQKFCEPIEVECVWWAKKPLSTKLTEAVQNHDVAPEHTVMLGDRWATDVLAARFAGVRAWQVQPRKKIV